MTSRFFPSRGQSSYKRPRDTKWEQYVESGRLIQSWITDPNEKGCIVPQSHLTFSDLERQGWKIENYRGAPFPSGCTPDAISLGIPYDPAELRKRDRSTQLVSMYFVPNNHTYSTHRWTSRVAKGAIFITNIERNLGAPRPWISELLKAVYESRFPLQTLRHIFVTVVVNEDTKHLVKDLLYTDERGLSWPDTTRRSWEHQTPEYHAVLGTRIGKMVGYFVLGSYPRGTQRIVRIVTWAGILNSVTLRFDLEESS